MPNIDHSDSTILKIFRNHGYKATPQRLAIARYMIHNQKHPTAHEIHAAVLEEHPSISLTTVYKTIHFLKEVNFLQEINLERDRARFDPNTKPHVHLVCMECGSIEDYEDPTIQRLNSKINYDTGFIIKLSNFKILGICKKCQKAQVSTILDLDQKH